MPRYKATPSESRIRRDGYQPYDIIDTEATPLPVEMSNGIRKDHAEFIVDRLNGPDQDKVDWSVVREAIMETADEEGIGSDKRLQSSFKEYGLLVMHKE